MPGKGRVSVCTGHYNVHKALRGLKPEIKIQVFRQEKKMVCIFVGSFAFVSWLCVPPTTPRELAILLWGPRTCRPPRIIELL